MSILSYGAVSSRSSSDTLLRYGDYTHTQRESRERERATWAHTDRERKGCISTLIERDYAYRDSTLGRFPYTQI